MRGKYSQVSCEKLLLRKKANKLQMKLGEPRHLILVCTVLRIKIRTKHTHKDSDRPPKFFIFFVFGCQETLTMRANEKLSHFICVLGAKGFPKIPRPSANSSALSRSAPPPKVLPGKPPSPPPKGPERPKNRPKRGYPKHWDVER